MVSRCLLVRKAEYFRGPFLRTVEGRSLTTINLKRSENGPQVALIIETSAIYGRRVLAGVARDLRSRGPGQSH
jgi:hypothetical protein